MYEAEIYIKFTMPWWFEWLCIGSWIFLFSGIFLEILINLWFDELGWNDVLFMLPCVCISIFQVWGELKTYTKLKRGVTLWFVLHSIEFRNNACLVSLSIAHFMLLVLVDTMHLFNRNLWFLRSCFLWNMGWMIFWLIVSVVLFFLDKIVWLLI